jgi:hypothetical protein
MKKRKDIEQDFLIDKLTNSVENVVTGDCFQTEISVLIQSDLKFLTKKMVGYLTGKLNLKNPREKSIN